MALKKVTKKRVAKKTMAKSTGVTATAKKRVTVKKKVAVKKRVLAKKQAVVNTTTSASPILMLEKEISTSQAKLAKAYASETALHEKNVAKLKTQLEKASAKQNLLKDRKEAALKNQAEKQTQAAKTRVVRANEALKANSAVIRGIRADLVSAKSAHIEAKKAQKKFSALEKLVAGFESSWVKAASKKRKIVRRPRKAASPKAADTSSEAVAVEEATAE